MSDPLVPPYFGSWHDLINALLHNPFLGSGRAPLQPAIGTPHHGAALHPSPAPWHAVAQFVSLIGLKQSARSVTDEGLRKRLLSQVESSIAALIDEYCGTPFPHWHWPGPPPWVSEIAAGLGVAASTVTGPAHDDLLAVGGLLLTRGLADRTAG